MKSTYLGQFRRALEQIRQSFTDIKEEKDPYWTFEELIRLEEELGVKSSFYFLEEKGKVNPLHPKTLFFIARRYEFKDEKVAEVIRRLSEGGWDVGLHGSYYSYDIEEILLMEKERLEAILGKPPLGIRQHHLNLNVPQTWRIQESCGFVYDTSLGFRDRPGFRWGTCFPFHPYDLEEGRPLRILEIPTVIMDTPLFYVKEDPWRPIEKMMDSVLEYGGALNLLWHHSVFNEKEFPGWMGRYRRIVETAKAQQAWITHGAAITDWWGFRKKSWLTVKREGAETQIELPSQRGLTLEVHTKATLKTEQATITSLNDNVYLLKPENDKIIIK